VEVVFIDFLQKLRPRRRHESYSIEVGKACARLKEFAVESGMAVVTTAQLNRRCEHREDRRPYLADIRSSGRIEELADLVLLLYRDEVYYPDTKRKGIAEVSVAKNRTGPSGTVHLRFDGPLMRFDVIRPDLDGL
jgi:replicative DNA helicase